MAGDWIKMRADLHDDPAVFRLASMLKLDRYSVVGRLHAFWAWADKHSVDGRVDGATPQLVDTVTTHEGFADALLVVGWLAHDDRGIAIPNFDRHNGKTAKERSLKNQRQERWRHRDEHVDASVDGAVDVKASTREEKRRSKEEHAPPEGGPVWGEGVQMLISRGDSERSARRFLGSLLKDWDESTVADALRAAESAKGDPKAYCRAVLKDRPRKGTGGLATRLAT